MEQPRIETYMYPCPLASATNPFARTAHSFPGTALLVSFARAAAFIQWFALLLTPKLVGK